MIDEILLKQYPNLKKSKKGSKGSEDVWSKNNIFAGLTKYYDEHGKYPNALEIDRFEYLPSSRQIQRSFGGLVKLRTELGLEVTNYTTGEVRSKIASLINTRATQVERAFEKQLIQHFGEYFVHVEKLLYNYFPSEYIYKNKVRADFFIYAKNYEFCIDVFYAKDIDTWKRIIDIKLPKYRPLILDTYLVNLNENSGVSEVNISHFIKNKKDPLPSHIQIFNKNNFLNYFKTIDPIDL